MDNFLDRVTLEGAGGQTDDTRSTFRVPLKTLGYYGSNYGSMVGTKISLKSESFSENCPVPKIFDREIFWGKYPRIPYPLRIQKVFLLLTFIN